MLRNDGQTILCLFNKDSPSWFFKVVSSSRLPWCIFLGDWKQVVTLPFKETKRLLGKIPRWRPEQANGVWLRAIPVFSLNWSVVLVRSLILENFVGKNIQFKLIALHTEDIQISLERFLILTFDALATKNMRFPVISPPFEILMLKMFHSYFSGSLDVQCAYG